MPFVPKELTAAETDAETKHPFTKTVAGVRTTPKAVNPKKKTRRGNFIELKNVDQSEYSPTPFVAINWILFSKEERNSPQSEHFEIISPATTPQTKKTIDITELI